MCQICLQMERVRHVLEAEFSRTIQKSDMLEWLCMRRCLLF